MKDKIEVEMLSPVMASFIPERSDSVDWEDADPLEGNELVSYQEAIAEKIDQVNRLGSPDDTPCNLMDYFYGSDSVREKVESITMGVKEQDNVLYGCASLTLRKPLTSREYVEVEEYLRGQYSDGWGESLEQREIKVDGGELYLHFYVGAGSDFRIQMKVLENRVQEKKPVKAAVQFGDNENIFSVLGAASRLLCRVGMKQEAAEMRERVWNSHSYEEARAIIDDYVENKLFADIEKTPKRKSHKKEDTCR